LVGLVDVNIKHIRKVARPSADHS